MENVSALRVAGHSSTVYGGGDGLNLIRHSLGTNFKQGLGLDDIYTSLKPKLIYESV